MAKVQLWGALRPSVGGAASITIEASTIRELFRKLEEQHPLMQPFIEEGISVSIDGVIYQDDWSQQLPPDSEIYLLPRIAGG
ncbi:molybdopterin synthase sulfur carrier subunit [Chromatiales bacterium (ex Bugula neritina AB1)]|nr:molybdopterin synthase sulfur carrier subunit [Chromatiales bacterium (ex Bugula neritina AB1)]